MDNNSDLLEEPIGSVLTLSEFFMNELENHAVPVNGHALFGVSTSSLAMDIYCWLTWRYFFLRREQKFEWDDLRQQFGTQTQTCKKFKETFGRALNQVRLVYPGMRAYPTKYGLILMPSRTSVPTIRRKF